MNKILCLILIGVLLIILVGCNTKDNKLEDKNLLLLEGSWKADGTQYRLIIGSDGDKPILDDDLLPYYLNFDGKGNLTMLIKGNTYTGIYQIDDEKQVILLPEELSLTTCQLKNDIELHCELYASLFIKE